MKTQIFRSNRSLLVILWLLLLSMGVGCKDKSNSLSSTLFSEKNAPSDEAAITSFTFEGLSPVVQATIEGTQISAEVPFGTDRSNLVPTIGLSEGAIVSPASGQAQDFSNLVTYEVTAADGVSKTSYSVLVSEAVKTNFTNTIGMDFVYVAPGTFMMGSDDGKPNERPVHEVEITQGYYIGKYEVTQAQWQEIMGGNPSWFGPNTLGANQINHPVEMVEWNGAQTFINLLNEREGGNFYRLPTEAEWEFAARGGNNSKGYIYAGGDNIDELARYRGNSTGLISYGSHYPVGTKEPNELGLYDMSGNVAEWCQDTYSSTYYADSPRENPNGPPLGNYKVVRGGSFDSFIENCRITSRAFSLDNFYGRENDIGLRLVRVQ